jgi:trimethylamine:corrinoid methyltransferase-like protein
MFQRHLIEDRHIEPIADATMHVMQRVGILCQNAELIDALAEWGAEVDRSDERVRFPRAMVEEFVEGLRREFATAADGDGVPRFVPPPHPLLSAQVAQYFYDDETATKRLGASEDFITLIKLGEAIHGDEGVGHSLLCTDAPPMLEPLQAAILLAEYALHPRWVYAWNVRQIPYLEEMGAILGVEDLWIWVAICFGHPLRFDTDVVDRFVAMARAGRPTGFTAMPVAGVTTPVSIEGFIAVSAAEHVATWMAARAINPSVPLAGSQWAGTVDMRTGAISYSAFDAMYYAFASIEFLRQWTGVSIPPGSGEYCDAKTPGMYAVLEKLYKSMTVAAFTGYHPNIGQGMLECGKVLSPAQLMLERDMSAGLRQYARMPEPSAELLALDLVTEVDLGLKTNYLEARHTLEHFRECLWLPEFVDRSGYAGPQSDEAALAAARARVQELVASVEKPEGREDKLEAMREVMAAARRELV